MATALAIAMILSLVGAYVRAPEAVLGVAFARACAAQAAVAEENQPRLRIEREDVHLDDVDALPASVEPTKNVVRRAEDRVSSLRLPAVPFATASFDLRPLAEDPGLGWRPIGPPTRQRARLMVFLN